MVVSPYWAAGTSAPQRREVWERLGRWVARLHHQGVSHGQLFAWHVRVDGDRLTFLDVATAHFGRAGGTCARRRCWRDLAALLSTLEHAACGRTERRRLLRAYGLDRASLRQDWTGLRCRRPRLEFPWRRASI